MMDRAVELGRGLERRADPRDRIAAIPLGFILRLPEASPGPKRQSRTNAVEVHVAARLRARRLELGVTQTAMAKGLGVGRQQLRRYEAAIQRLGASRLYDAARLLGVSIDRFFEGLEAGGDPAPGSAPPAISEARDLLRHYAAIPAAKRRGFRQLVRRLADAPEGDASNTAGASAGTR